MVAVRMRVTGHSQADIKATLRQRAPAAREKPEGGELNTATYLIIINLLQSICYDAAGGIILRSVWHKQHAVGDYGSSVHTGVVRTG